MSTEPDAGSDVGAARPRAVDQGDGTWLIEGGKRFITSADSDDLFENIAHLVLARPVGAPPQTKQCFSPTLCCPGWPPIGWRSNLRAWPQWNSTRTGSEVWWFIRALIG